MSRAVLIQCKVSDFQIGSHPGGIKSRKDLHRAEKKAKGNKCKLSVLFKFCVHPEVY